MTRKTTLIFILLILLALTGVGVYYYPYLPAQVATHWSAAGEVNGYMGKFWGLFLLPIMAVVIAGFMFLLPKIDPLRRNIESFQKEYNLLILTVVVLLAYLQILMLVWNLGMRFDFTRFVGVALGAMFFVIGLILPKTKRNWWVGIRTPWTLSSDKVWERVHRHGGKLFKAVGVAAIVGSFWGAKGLIAAVVLVVAASMWLSVYSYLVFRQ